MSVAETLSRSALARVRESVREALSCFPDIDLAVLFGSLSTGRARADSDVDLAVGARRPLSATEMLRITQAVAARTGRPVDLIDLANVPEPLLGQIVTQGQRVQGSAAEFARLINRHLVEQADFMPLRDRILTERRVAWIGR